MELMRLHRTANESPSSIAEAFTKPCLIFQLISKPLVTNVRKQSDYKEIFSLLGCYEA
jgi:hypothetical protein